MMKSLLTALSILTAFSIEAQTNPAITSWLRNTTGTTGRHYVKGNTTPINDADSVNVQTVYYSSNYVYVRTKGVPSYITGPFLDGNPSITTNQNAIFKFPLKPTKNTTTNTSTTGGDIGVFINGVALFDYRDGYSWNNTDQKVEGGPGGGKGDGVWNRDAIVGETIGFDCAKGHPAMGNYHHHQNPSAFKLDLKTVSTVCSIYDADGLYVIDSTKHSPLIGFTYDGFPIYGAYGYKNTDGTGGITRIKSSYSKRNITVRNTYSNGTSVTPGPNVSTTYPLGYFREDYQYDTTSASTPDYLDEHNGRFCVTPEYPAGTYCYFATVDSNWNSAYPYVVGPTFYGVYSNAKVTAVPTAGVTIYTGTPLPINLLSFNGFFDNKAVVLGWEVAINTQNARFEIERSINGTNFVKIGELAANKSTQDEKLYSFTDKSPLQGKSQYRLLIIDENGSSKLSSTIEITNRNQSFSFRVFPNPASDYIYVQANDILTEDAQVVLMDMKGNVLQTHSLPQGSTFCMLETATLYEGNYVVAIKNTKSINTYKLVLVK